MADDARNNHRARKRRAPEPERTMSHPVGLAIDGRLGNSATLAGPPMTRRPEVEALVERWRAHELRHAVTKEVRRIFERTCDNEFDDALQTAVDLLCALGEDGDG